MRALDLFHPLLHEKQQNEKITLYDNEMIYIQMYLEGVVHTNFICCCHIECGTAEGIVHAIKRSMETVIDWDQSITKLVALELDGAAVMLGKNSGVITLLQAQQPSMTAVHYSRP